MTALNNLLSRVKNIFVQSEKRNVVSRKNET